MKPDPMPRWNSPETAVDQYGRVHALVPERSIAPTAIDAKQLSDIINQLGTVYHGTLVAGAGEGTDKKTARVVVGQDAGGIQAYDAASRNFFALNWADQSFRLGYIDAPQIRMRDGSVEVDGDVLVAGTVSASRLKAGTTVQLLVSDGILAFGTGNAEYPIDPTNPFSGIRAAQDAIPAGSTDGSGTLMSTVSERISQFCGFHNGVITWGIDNTDGSFRSMGAGAPDEVYTKISEGTIELSNVADYTGAASQLQFISHRYNSAGVDTITGVGVFLERGGLVVQPTTDPLFTMGVELRDAAGQKWADWQYSTLELRYPYGSNYRTLVGVDSAQGYVSTDAGSLILSADSRSSLSAYIALTTERVAIGYGVLAFYDSELGWQARPPAPDAHEMILRPDPINHRMELWTGTEWVYLQTAAA